MTAEGADDGNSVVGVRRQSKKLTLKQTRVMLVVAIVGLACVVDLGIKAHDLILLPLYVLIPLSSHMWIRLRPPTVVSAQGIRRPWFRLSVIAWRDVESIAQPELGNWAAHINLTSGKRLSLLDVPATETAQIAAIGHKPVKAPRYARTPTPHSMPNRTKTPMEIEADVTRAAQALAIHRAEMAAEAPPVASPTLGLSD